MGDIPGLEPATLFIFGASGDLTRRKIVPALYSLFLDGLLPDLFCLVGVFRTRMSDEDFRLQLRAGVDKFSRRGKTGEVHWEAFAGKIRCITVDYADPAMYGALTAVLDQPWQPTANQIFYLATPPQLFAGLLHCLGQEGRFRGHKQYRVVVEKPFGRDLASARQLNEMMATVFDELQIYRIDHYLGKETVQNILAFRFANSVWEPVWNRNYIDHVQITVAEKLGIGLRGGYYETAGALRDMMQNHLMQLLCLVAMEPPTSFAADEIRNKKTDVMRAIRPISYEEVPTAAIRGQYAAGTVEGEKVSAYREEQGVSATSERETFAAVKLFIDNWRWQGIPFYLRTGKRMPARVSEISLQFRPIPHSLFFSDTTEDTIPPNRLAIQIEPQEGILLRTQAKEPGLGMNLTSVEMHYRYHEEFKFPSPDAYETLLVDILRGDPGLFMRADQVEAAWSIFDPILKFWRATPATAFPNYFAGSWGPACAEQLITQNKRAWFVPACLESKE